MPNEPAYVLGMSADSPPASMTAAELLLIPDKHAELVRGALVVREPPGLRHGRIAMEIAAALGAHVRAQQLGRVYVESGFKLTSNPDTVRGPDVAFISQSRLPEPEPVGYPALAPDLVVQILSPGDQPGRCSARWLTGCPRALGSCGSWTRSAAWPVCIAATAPRQSSPPNRRFRAKTSCPASSARSRLFCRRRAVSVTTPASRSSSLTTWLVVCSHLAVHPSRADTTLEPQVIT